MEHYKILRDLQAGKVDPIYFLMGEESYFIDEVVTFMENNLLDESEKAFNQTVIYGRDVSMEQIISTAKGFPMMGERQVVIVKEAQDIREWKKSDDLKSLEHYIENPQSSTVLVFAHKNKNLNKRLKAWKLLKKHAVILESSKLRDYKVPEWIKGYVESKGYKIDNATSQLLGEYLGNNLSKLTNELSKLMIVLGKGTAINRQHVEENIGISKDYNVFELQKALGEKNIMKANRIINYFESNPKANPIQMVLPLLYNYFSKILVYKTLKDRTNIAASLGTSPWQAKQFAEVSGNFKTEKIMRIIGYIRETDQKSKGVNNYGITDGFLLKEMVFKMLHY